MDLWARVRYYETPGIPKRELKALYGDPSVGLVIYRIPKRELKARDGSVFHRNDIYESRKGS